MFSMDRNHLVLVRGPCGSGKSTLCLAWAGREPYDFQLLSTDEVQDGVDFSDLSDEDEFTIVLERVGGEIADRLNHGPLLVDAGLRDPTHVDAVLGPSGRRRGDTDVALVRLAVGVEEAVRRKRDLPEARVRELHEKWQTRPITGESVLRTDGLSEGEVARPFGSLLTALVPRSEKGPALAGSTRLP
jgi:hypothetical protein